jgi:hypothetical protein
VSSPQFDDLKVIEAEPPARSTRADEGAVIELP